MNKVLECARTLGQTILDSEEYKNMQQTEKDAMSDPEVTAVISKYMEYKTQLESVMNDGGEPEEIARVGQLMDDAKRTLDAMPKVDAMTSSREEFSRMMNQVSQILEFMITGEVAGGSCSGDCGSCGGCH